MSGILKSWRRIINLLFILKCCNILTTTSYLLCTRACDAALQTITGGLQWCPRPHYSEWKQRLSKSTYGPLKYVIQANIEQNEVLIFFWKHWEFWSNVQNMLIFCERDFYVWLITVLVMQDCLNIISYISH